MSRRVYLLVDIQDAAVETDEERPPRRERLIFADNAVRRRDRLRWIAEQWIVEAKRLRERLVRRGGIDAGGKIGDIEPADCFATLTE